MNESIKKQEDRIRNFLNSQLHNTISRENEIQAIWQSGWFIYIYLNEKVKFKFLKRQFTYFPIKGSF